MPRKAAAPAEPAEARRSTRIAEKPQSAAAQPAPAAKKASASKNKRDSTDEEGPSEGEPAPKKVKPDSKAKPQSKAKPESKSAKATKPTSKAAGKPSSKAAPAAAPADEAEKAAKTVEAIPEEEEPAEKKADDKMEEEKKEPEPAPEPQAVAEVEKEKADEAALKKDDAMEVDANPNAEPAPEEAEVGELELGDKLPDWTFKNEKDEDVPIAKLAGEKGLVLFLVPKADTPGCNTQACGFRDSFPEFEKYGYAVYGLSSDKSAAQAKWQTKKNLPYSLLSDPTRKLIKILGAKSGNSTKRSHVIFEKGTGKLVEKKNGVKPADSPKNALAFIQKHHPEVEAPAAAA